MIPAAPRDRPAWSLHPAVMYAIAGVLMATAAGIGVAIAFEMARREAIVRPPIGTARITDSTIERSRRSSTGRIYYRREGGEGREENCVVPPSRARTVTIGEVVNLHGFSFLGARELIAPCAQAARDAATVEVVALAAMALAALGGGAWLAWRSARFYRVLRDGAPAAGQLRSVRRFGRGRKASFKVAFTFDAAGSVVEGARRLPRDRAVKMFGGEPQEGLVIGVVYDPANPRLHEIWGRG